MVSTSTWGAAGIVAVATIAVSVANLVFLGINAQRTREHELRVLRETRTQQRIETAYSDFIALMDHIANLFSSFLQRVPLNADDHLARMEISEKVGLIKTFGSDDVIREADRWGDIHHAIVEALVADDFPLVALKLDELRVQEHVVRDVMRPELRPPADEDDPR